MSEFKQLGRNICKCQIKLNIYLGNHKHQLCAKLCDEKIRNYENILNSEQNIVADTLTIFMPDATKIIQIKLSKLIIEKIAALTSKCRRGHMHMSRF